MRDNLRYNGLLDVSPDLFASHDYGELRRQFYQTARGIALQRQPGG